MKFFQIKDKKYNFLKSLYSKIKGLKVKYK